VSDGRLIDVLLMEVDGQRVGIPSAAVVEVLPCARPARLDRAPPFVEGLLNVRGRVLPVLSMRERLGRPARPPSADDHLVLVDTGPRRLLLRVDHALDLIGVDPDRLEPLDAQHRPFGGAAAAPEGVLLVQDPERFLTADEASALDASTASPSDPPA